MLERSSVQPCNLRVAQELGGSYCHLVVHKKEDWLPTILFAKGLAFHSVVAPSVLNRVKSYSGGAIFSKTNKCAPPCSSSPISTYPSFCSFSVSFCPVETRNVSFTAY